MACTALDNIQCIALEIAVLRRNGINAGKQQHTLNPVKIGPCDTLSVTCIHSILKRRLLLFHLLSG